MLELIVIFYNNEHKTNKSVKILFNLIDIQNVTYTTPKYWRTYEANITKSRARYTSQPRRISNLPPFELTGHCLLIRHPKAPALIFNQGWNKIEDSFKRKKLVWEDILMFTYEILSLTLPIVQDFCH